MPHALAGLVLAAGASARFGSPKPLASFRGEPLVVRTTRLLLGVCPAGVVVVTGCHGSGVGAAVQAALAGLPVTVTLNPDWADGLASSLRCGLAAIPAPASAALVMPCDLPVVTAADLERLITAWAGAPGRVAAASFAGGLGPPAVLPRSLWPACATLHGDRGARDIITAALDRVEVPMASAALDVDTQADLTRLEVI